MLVDSTDGNRCHHWAAAAQKKISTTMTAGVFIHRRRQASSLCLNITTFWNKCTVTLKQLCPLSISHPFHDTWTPGGCARLCLFVCVIECFVQLPFFDVQPFCYVCQNQTGGRRPHSSWLCKKRPALFSLTKQNVNHWYSCATWLSVWLMEDGRWRSKKQINKWNAPVWTTKT